MDVIVFTRNKKPTVQEIEVTIESPAGSFRHGPDWIQKMANDYGYIEDTIGADGDEVDAFIGPNLESECIFIIEQVKENGDFDEHKVMIGFSNMAEAKDAYHANYPEGWNGLKNMQEIKAKDFWGWYEGLSGIKNNKVDGIEWYRGYKLHIYSDGSVEVFERYLHRGMFDSRKEAKEFIDRKEDKKENAMNEPYKFADHNASQLLERGRDRFGSPKNNSCDCPKCYGGGRYGMFACENCKGIGKIVVNENEGQEVLKHGEDEQCEGGSPVKKKKKMGPYFEGSEKAK